MADEQTPGRDYDPRTYWSGLLGDKLDLRGTGYATLSLAFNRWQYRARLSSVRRLGLDVAGKKVLDVGVGTGFWLRYWRAAGAASVGGVDLTPESVALMAATYPVDKFQVLDVSKEVPAAGPYDVVSAFDVLLHVTEDDAYRTALGNLRRCVAPGGLLVLAEPLAEEPVRFVPGSHSRARRTDDVVNWLADEGWRTKKVVPMVWLLGNPIERSMVSRYFALRLAWAAMAVSSRAELPGYLVGAAVYPVDRALARLRFGPSSKLVLAEAL